MDDYIDKRCVIAALRTIRENMEKNPAIDPSRLATPCQHHSEAVAARALDHWLVMTNLEKRLYRNRSTYACHACRLAYAFDLPLDGRHVAR